MILFSQINILECVTFMCDSEGGHRQAPSENIVFNFQQKGIKKAMADGRTAFSSGPAEEMLPPGESSRIYCDKTNTHL